MKNIIFLLTIFFLLDYSYAQHKTLTIYYPDSSRIINMTNVDSMSLFICGASKVNYAGQTYTTVLIGNQCWFKENLNVGVMDYPSNNGIIEKYCYENLQSNCDLYGGLYYWNEAMQYVTTEGAQGICPTGWHMPKLDELNELISFVDSSSNALKREDQGSGQGQGTNTSGFSALLSGGKQYSGGPFIGLGNTGWYQVGKKGSGSYAYNFTINANDNIINVYSNAILSWGMSVRCIKN